MVLCQVLITRDMLSTTGQLRIPLNNIYGRKVVKITGINLSDTTTNNLIYKLTIEELKIFGGNAPDLIFVINGSGTSGSDYYKGVNVTYPASPMTGFLTMTLQSATINAGPAVPTWTAIDNTRSFQALVMYMEIEDANN